MYANILVATDGSPLAQRGVDQGIALAARIGATVTFVVVSELFTGITLEGESPIGLFSGSADLKQAAESAAERILQKVSAQAKAAGVACETVHVRDMVPADGILETATKRGCDLIVVSSHGRRGIERLLLGSQANDVVTRAKVPVLVAR
jgi:nucleotide-binding universal stress UspA family protein